MDSHDTHPTLGRRNLLRGGVAAATAAGLGVASIAAAPAAAAANGDPVELAGANAETATTAITISGSAGDRASAVLSLINQDGPALKLNTLPEDWPGELQAGEVATVESGPIVGLADGSTTFLATGLDLLSLPVTVPLSPVRLLDLRTVAGRKALVGNSPNAFDVQGRLRAGAWMDVSLGDADGSISLAGLYATVTVTGSSGGGYLTVYPPEGTSRPATSNLNFASQQTIANLVFTAVATSTASAFVVRIYASATTYVILDINGVIAQINLTGNAPADVRSRSAASSLATLSHQATRMLTAASAGK